MKYVRRIACGLFSATALLLLADGCGGGQGSTDCRQSSWSGRCQLKGVATVKRLERFPRAFVVLEALYEPAAGSPPGAPPELRQQFTAEATQENDLRLHLQQYPVVACAADVVQGAPCGQLEARVDVPPFTAAPAVAASSSEPRGCEQIEKGGGHAASKPFPEEFRFEEHSADASPDVRAIADRVAQLLRSDASIQCVALNGQVSFGEDLGLGERRARLVKQLLTERGIEPHRLTIFGGNAPLYAGTAPNERVAIPSHRHVRLTVVVSARTP